MTALPSLQFRIDATGCGAALHALANDIAPLLRPGDSVLWLDRGSDDDTAAQIASLPAPSGSAEPDWSIALCGTDRLLPAAFVSARRLTAQSGIDLIYQSLHRSGGMLIRSGLLPPPDAGWATLWRLIQGAATCPAPLPYLRRRTRPLSPADLAVLRDLPATARDWAQAVLDAHPAGPGPRAMLAPHLDGFRLPAPPVLRGAPLRVHLAGRHAPRMPLGWDDLADTWADGATLTADPARADLILWAHPRDLTEMPRRIARARAPHVLMSEEPFWDSLFSPDPLAEEITLPAPHLGLVRLHQRNHHTSPIFAHDRLPYYLFTQNGLIPAYQRLFLRNAALNAQAWQSAFAARKTDTVFMAERRPEPFHDLHIAGGDITGLCAWRTRLALAAPGNVQRVGASWDGSVPRLALTDWHADKLAQMDGATRILSALENTHQPAYLSEKLFDAFACGARPLYYASPRHRVHDLGLPEMSWINLAGETSDEAASHLRRIAWGKDFFDGYVAAQKRLAALFTDHAVLDAERKRIGRAILSDLTLCAARGPA